MESQTHEPAPDVCLDGNDTGEKLRSYAGKNMTESKRHWWSDFAVHGIFWRRFVDRGVCVVPAVLHAPLVWTGAVLFFFVAGPARKALLCNLRLIEPNSSRILNYVRVLRVFANFGWSLTDAVTYRLKKGRFQYEIEGGTFLDKLGSDDAAIILTAHMGNYDLGAAAFAARFNRQIRMVRAPEPDALAAQHVDLALQESSAGAVKIGYSDDGTSLALELLNALRAGEIISIQGDRVVGEMARASVMFFQREILLPNGPFVLAYVSGRPIYPMFVVRTGRWKYKVIAHEPIVLSRLGASRDEIIATAMQRWSSVLEKTVRIRWPQWFAFTRLSSRD